MTLITRYRLNKVIPNVRALKVTEIVPLDLSIL